MTVTYGGSPGPVTLPRPRKPTPQKLLVDEPSVPEASTAVGVPARVPTPVEGRTAGRSASAPHRATDAHVGRSAVGRVRLTTQICVVAVAVAAYFLVRGATEAAYGDALRHARTLVDLERWLGIYWEPALQESLATSPRVTTVLNWIYIYGHWPVIVMSLLWLAYRHPQVYLRTRNAMLLSGAIGLVVFISFPVAPPRLAGLGMVDTISVASDSYRVLQPPMFTNQYAALPSLHVGWDLLIGLALASTLRRPLSRALVLVMPAAMVVAVVLTANHYIVDAVAGAALTSGCWLLVRRGRGHRILQDTGRFARWIAERFAHRDSLRLPVPEHPTDRRGLPAPRSPQRSPGREPSTDRAAAARTPRQVMLPGPIPTAAAQLSDAQRE